MFLIPEDGTRRDEACLDTHNERKTHSGCTEIWRRNWSNLRMRSIRSPIRIVQTRRLSTMYLEERWNRSARLHFVYML